MVRILSWCGVLTESNHLFRPDSALKVLWWCLIWESQMTFSQPVYESDDAQAYWDVQVFGENGEVRTNRAGWSPNRQSRGQAIIYRPQNDLSVNQRSKPIPCISSSIFAILQFYNTQLILWVPQWPLVSFLATFFHAWNNGSKKTADKVSLAGSALACKAVGQAG